MRKLRRRRLGPVTLTAGLFVAAGVGAAGVMFSDRLADVWRGKDWAEPSTAWMALFHEKGTPKAIREAKVENAVLITPPPAPRLQEPPAPRVQEPPAALVQEQPRRPTESTSTSAASSPPATIPTSAASSPPATTSTVAAAAGGRELPWLPEAEKRAESLESNPPPPQPRVAVASPEVAPITLPSSPPAANSPPASEIAELIKRARARIELGDISGARLLLERAASGNEPSALMALAETYDPTMLTKWGARGLKADPGKARALYLKAAERGLAEAKARMLALR